MELSLEELTTRRRIARHGAQLVPRQVHTGSITRSWCIVVACVRNELPRLPRFLGHYRHLGAAHFLFVDNASTDGSESYLCSQPDCSVWRAEGSYREANFGMDWCNHLLTEFGVGKWCVTVDPDEFLLFPYCEDRGLRSLTRYMESIGQPSLFAPLMDVYSDRPLSQTPLTAETDPFALCPWFDRFNLTQHWDEAKGNFWVQGGVRMRRFFADRPAKAPALNKVPLIRWERGLRYESSMHHTNRRAFNCSLRGRPEAVSGVLFHFKYVNLLSQKASEEMQRQEHYDGSAEYRAYLDAGDPVLFDPEVSVRFTGTRQLREMGFMQAGGWF